MKKKEEATRLVNSQQSSSSTRVLPIVGGTVTGQQQTSKSHNILNMYDGKTTDQRSVVSNPYFDKVAASTSSDIFAKKTDYQMNEDEAKLFGTFQGFFRKAWPVKQEQTK
jgi:hypothetical protein